MLVRVEMCIEHTNQACVPVRSCTACALCGYVCGRLPVRWRSSRDVPAPDCQANVRAIRYPNPQVSATSCSRTHPAFVVSPYCVRNGTLASPNALSVLVVSHSSRKAAGASGGRMMGRRPWAVERVSRARAGLNGRKRRWQGGGDVEITACVLGRQRFGGVCRCTY
ncbi:hypothetical protein BC628DRAFT_494957 [Trametes gibbosa]|nr:hypothetical protein BC628DRAFT_494957 [Trametes gibbosa]